VPLPRSFKTDESFLEKIAIGATGTRRTFDDLDDQGHEPLELERGSMSFKIWKSIKIKRVRVPDILCLRCSRRVESRAKTKMEISMSHSLSDPARGWDVGLSDDDAVALAHCQRVGPGPVDWAADPLVQYLLMTDLRRSWREGHVRIEHPKGAQEGFEIRVTWPSAVASGAGVVEQVTDELIRYRKLVDGRVVSVRLERTGESGRRVRLKPLVAPGEHVRASQIIASVVPVSGRFPCPGGADVGTYIRLAASSALSDRYTAVKALGYFEDPAAIAALASRVEDEREHVYVRLDAAASLMRRGRPEGRQVLVEALRDYLMNRLEAVIVLGEVATPEAAEMLVETLSDTHQASDIRAGAAWALGEIGTRAALPALVRSFRSLELAIKVEAARALAKLARRHVDAVLQAFPSSIPEERPGIAWALSKAGGFRIEQILPALVDDDARHWGAYIIGTQDQATMLPQIEALAARDPEVYFGVTLLWKIIASWTYGLEEY